MSTYKEIIYYKCNVFRHLNVCYLQLNGNLLLFKFLFNAISAFDPLKQDLSTYLHVIS